MYRKKDLLLDKIIQEYIQSQSPIGSESLKMSMSIKISSATIRNYFKALCDEGILTQTHISSGRIPTALALKNYWRSKLNIKDSTPQVDLKKFQAACEGKGIFGIIKTKVPQKLRAVINCEHQFLILDFETDQIALRFNPSIERFAKELVGLEVQDIRQIAHQVCANALLEKLERMGESCELFYFGVEFLGFLLQYSGYQQLFFEITSGRIFDRLPKGIYFENAVPKGSIAIIQDIQLHQKEAKMLCMGALDRDYTDFYDQIAS
ncbi:hypothetical protein BKH46_06470 [Helicobacter sp. 12S02634-8]|nr:hypothetical protein BKH46_06470 [Helicobacter sp. 12S02634-8]